MSSSGSDPRAKAKETAPALGRWRSRHWGSVVVVLALLLVGVLIPSTAAAPPLLSPFAPLAMNEAKGPVPAPTSLLPHVRSNPAPTPQCDGMLWTSTIWASYVPAYCYGHDEPTTSYVSTAAGSGANARYRLSLPADGATYGQGDFYATIWFGGVVYDTNSTHGGSQAFLEFQFYPAPPMFTGTGSGTQDCLPDGSFYPVYTLGSNVWFACAIVWQLNGTTSITETAAFAGPLDARGTSAILVLHSNDQLFLNMSGVAQSPTRGWNLSVVDTTTGGSGNVSLVNGPLVLSPYYSTAAAGNSLLWGASNPGAISYAYEVGHSLDPALPVTCAPGDGACDSYWPGRWAAAGQAQFGLPVVGATGSQTFPTTMYFSSSQGGEAEVNGSVCGAPSFSVATNCMYPYFQYRGGSYSFTFGASDVTNATHDYGNEYEFPATTNIRGQWNGDTRVAPWGSLAVPVIPVTATVDFNPIGRTVPVPLAAGMATGQFVEGPYWLNVSAPGCVASSTFVYLKTAATYSTPVQLLCAGEFTVAFNETGLPPSTAWSVTFNGTTISSTSNPISFLSRNGTWPYSIQSQVLGSPSGVAYNATPPISGTVHVVGVPVTVPVRYSIVYLLNGYASPAAGGTVTPVSVYYAPSTAVRLVATPAAGWMFLSWTGFGASSYTGTQNPAVFTINGPVQETGNFALIPTYSVTFQESGLPVGALWKATLNGVTLSSNASRILFPPMVNGTYPFNISSYNGYTVTPQRGTVPLAGMDAVIAISFTPPPIAGFLTPLDLELLLVVVALVIAGVVVAAARRRRPPPSAPPTAPPSWLPPTPPPR